MLSCDQIAELAGALCATAETLGQTLSASAAQLMAEDLAEYNPDSVVAALRACRREHTGKLTLAAILQRVSEADGRPGKDEAWSIALAGSDEFDTVVLTDEIQKAMTVSAPILEMGDKVGARMAFISAYERLVADARREKRPASWSVSLGFDPDRRVRAIETAVRLNRLPQPVADRELRRISYSGPAGTDGVAIAGLITGKGAAPSAKNRERFRVLKADVERVAREREEQRAAAAAARVAAFEARRSAAMKAIEEAQRRGDQR